MRSVSAMRERNSAGGSELAPPALYDVSSRYLAASRWAPVTLDVPRGLEDRMYSSTTKSADRGAEHVMRIGSKARVNQST